MMMCNQNVPCPGDERTFFCGYNRAGQGKCITCSLLCTDHGTYHESGACDHLCPGFRRYYLSLPKEHLPQTTTPRLKSTEALTPDFSKQEASSSDTSDNTAFILGLGLCIFTVILIVALCIWKRKQIRRLLSKVRPNSRNTHMQTVYTPNDNSTPQPENIELLPLTQKRNSSDLHEVVVSDKTRNTKVSVHSITDFQEDVTVDQSFKCSNEGAMINNHDKTESHTSSDAKPKSDNDIDPLVQRNVSVNENSVKNNASVLQSGVNLPPGYHSDVLEHDETVSVSEHKNDSNTSLHDAEYSKIPESKNDTNTSPSIDVEHPETAISSRDPLQSFLNAGLHNTPTKSANGNSLGSAPHPLTLNDFPADRRQKDTPSPQTNRASQNNVNRRSSGERRLNANGSDSGTREFQHKFREHPNKEQGLNAQPCPDTTGALLVNSEQRQDSQRSRDVVTLRSNDIPRNDMYNSPDNIQQPLTSGAPLVTPEQRQDSHRSRDVVALRSNDIPRNDLYTSPDNKQQPLSSDSRSIHAEQREDSHRSRDAVALQSNDIPRNDMYSDVDNK